MSLTTEAKETSLRSMVFSVFSIDNFILPYCLHEVLLPDSQGYRHLIPIGLFSVGLFKSSNIFIYFMWLLRVQHPQFELVKQIMNVLSIFVL